MAALVLGVLLLRKIRPKPVPVGGEPGDGWDVVDDGHLLGGVDGAPVDLAAGQEPVQSVGGMAGSSGVGAHCAAGPSQVAQ